MTKDCFSSGWTDMGYKINIMRMQVGDRDYFQGTASGVWNEACWPFSYWWYKSLSKKLTSSSSKRQELYQGLAPLTSKAPIQHRLHGYAHECVYTHTLSYTSQSTPGVWAKRESATDPWTQIRFPHLNPSAVQNKRPYSSLALPGPIEIKSPFTIIRCKAQKKRSPRRAEAPSYNHLPSLGGGSMKDPPSVI